MTLATPSSRRKTATRSMPAKKTAPTKKATSKLGPGLTIRRNFTTAGTDPYDTVRWELRDIVQKNWKTDEIVFEQYGVELPATWSVNAGTIAVTKYFRGSLGTDARETSLKQVIDRVVDTYTQQGVENGYFADAASVENFNAELKYLLLHQYFAFNSPVWFNIGWPGREQFVSACFILGVDDDMPSILNWYTEEGNIFKGGSGAGVNLSRIRSAKEHLSSGGTASGPVSFMRGADASAGTIKSGGAVRRAAKMVVLDVDHPDIYEFIETKAREEDKIRALRDAGFDMDLGGKDIISVQYQNANNSVMVSDKFMRAVEEDKPFDLTARTTGETLQTVDARQLFRKMAQAAWECADPGIMYGDTMNKWHTLSAHSPITASNPCGEFLSIENSSCNLASLNLMKFLNDDNTFDLNSFIKVVELVIIAMDISICFADFPTEQIKQNTRDYRQLGIGYANLGALLMATGHAYDSNDGRDLAAAITSLMSAAAHVQSARIAEAMGPYKDWNKAHSTAHTQIVQMHRNVAAGVAPMTGPKQRTANEIGSKAFDLWTTALAMTEKSGLRNSQLSLLAPTGTIGFLLDADTTGIEPDFSLVKFKKLVGGGSMQIVNNTMTRALGSLGYDPEQIDDIVAFIKEHGDVVGAPWLDGSDYAVFDCAVGKNRYIAPMGHVLMMAAVQPFLSGAISKTINLPESATVEDIENVYLQGWKLGLKDLAVYRDNCKVGQPLSADSGKKTDTAAKPQAVVVQTIERERIVYKPHRDRLSRKRNSTTTSFAVAGAEGYLTAGTYDDGRLGEIFLKFGKQGSTLAGVMDAFSIAISVALQYGVPLETFVAKFMNQKFEPSGMTDDPEIKMAQSLMDYVFRRLAIDHMPFEERAGFNIYTVAERTQYAETGSYALTDEENALLQQDDLSSTPALADLEDEEDIPKVSVSQHSVPINHTSPASPAGSGTETSKQAHSNTELAEQLTGHVSDAPLCMTCGTKMQRAGACYVCDGCGNTSGCS